MALTSDDLRQIVNIIRVQRDRKMINTSRKSVLINPQSLTHNDITTYGPYEFNTTFTTAPDIAFGQTRDSSLDRLKGILVVVPLVYSWVVQSGGVTGFTLGVYTLTPIPEGLTKHTVSWNATGKASYYKAEGVDDKWAATYNLNSASHLVSEPGLTGEQVG